MRKTICALILFALSSCRNEYDVLQQEKENSILEQSNKVFSSELIDVRKVKKEIDWQKVERSLSSLKEKDLLIRLMMLFYIVRLLIQKRKPLHILCLFIFILRRSLIILFSK